MVGAIADTHAVIWYLLDSPRLSNRVAAEFERCQTAAMLIGVSSMTIIEIVYLIEKNRIPEMTLGLLRERLQQSNSPLEIAPSTDDIATAIQLIPRDQIPESPVFVSFRVIRVVRVVRVPFSMLWVPVPT